MLRSHNLRKFPQIFAVSTGVALVIMRILCILFKSLLLSKSQPPRAVARALIGVGWGVYIHIFVITTNFF